MEVLSSFASGLLLALSPQNLLFALVGSIIGTLVGVLPGVGPVAGIAILLPVTFDMPAVGALIMLAAIYYGTMYGGTITSVLMNVPGESASVVTAIEGYEMAKRGRAGAALAIAAIGSFIGGCAATVAMILLARPLTALGLLFGPPEFFALVLVGFSLLIGLAGDSALKAIVSTLFGLALTLPGLDPMIGTPRLTFGVQELFDGLGFVPVLMGLFGVSEILLNIEGRQAAFSGARVQSLFITRADWRESRWPIARGTLVGFFIGVVPGLGAATASFVSYALEKRVARNPEQFGKGAIAGVAAPETANNAASNAAFLPLLTLGIPGSASVALLLGAFLINDITPGPFLFRDHPDVVWALIASMLVGNVMLLVLNLPLVGLWAKVLLIPYPLLFAIILVFAIVGSYSISGSMFDVGVMLVFGLVGYLLRKLGFPLAPIALTLVLGPQFEHSLRQSLVLSNGDYAIFFRSAISTTLVCVAVIAVLLSVARPAMALVRGMKREDSEV